MAKRRQGTPKKDRRLVRCDGCGWVGKNTHAKGDFEPSPSPTALVHFAFPRDEDYADGCRKCGCVTATFAHAA